MPLFKIDKELNAKVFALFVEALISGAFIKTITDSIKNSFSLIGISYLIIIPIFTIVDFIVWLKTGQEIIIYLVEQFGIEFQ